MCILIGVALATPLTRNHTLEVRFRVLILLDDRGNTPTSITPLSDSRKSSSLIFSDHHSIPLPFPSLALTRRSQEHRGRKDLNYGRSASLHSLIQIHPLFTLLSLAFLLATATVGSEGFDPRPDVLASLRASGLVQIILRSILAAHGVVRRENMGSEGFEPPID